MTDSFYIVCPHCRVKLRVAASNTGGKARCSHCHKVCRVGVPEVPVASLPSQQPPLIHTEKETHHHYHAASNETGCWIALGIALIVAMLALLVAVSLP